MNTRIGAVMVVSCLLGALAVPVRAQQEDVYKAVAGYDYSKSRKDQAAVEEQIRKATAEQYPAIEAKLIEALGAATTPEAKRFICRQLQVIGSGKSVPAIAALLGDEKVSHEARMALEAIGDPAAAGALRAALGQVKGKQLIGVIASIGVKRDSEAVGDLMKLAADADSAVAGAAMHALGEIGSTAAARALAAVRPAEALREINAEAQLVAAQKLAAEGKGAEANAIYQRMNAAGPTKAIRIAGLRGSIATLPATAAARLAIATLQGQNDELKVAAVAAIHSAADNTTNKELANAVAAELANLTPAAQALVLPVLADKKDVNLRPALVKILSEGKDAKVRALAMEAMVWHGQPEDVAMLVKMAAGGEDASRAKQTLEKMNRADLNDALIQVASAGEGAQRVVAIATLNSRRAEKALPAMVVWVGDPDKAVASEAAKALGTMGSAAQLPSLVVMIVAAGSDQQRGTAEEAAKAVCSRETNKQACAGAILSAMGQAQGAAKASLVRTLSRIGTDEALAAARQAAGSEDAQVREVAIREMADWPSLAAAPALLELAKNSQNQTHAILAMRGYLRLAGNAKDRAPAERVAMYKAAMETAKRSDEKKLVIAGLATVPSFEALDLILQNLGDEALKAEATVAGISLAKQIAPAGKDRAKAALEKIKASAGSEETKQQADDALAAINNSASADGYIVGWMVSGPYTQADKDGAALFDIAFGPEKGEGEWRLLMGAVDAANPRVINLDRVFQGNDRVVYLQVKINSTKAQDARLEMGSDDGIKVWLNGTVVHANNVVRPVTPGQDRARISLKQGENVLLVKVNQGAGQYGASVRLRGGRGEELQGVSVTAE